MPRRSFPGFHPPPSDFAKSTIDQRRASRRRMRQRFRREQRALRVEHFENDVRPGVVAERRDFERCRSCSRRAVSAATLRPRTFSPGRRALREGVLHRLLVIHRQSVAAGRGRLDGGLDGFQSEQRLEQPETGIATRWPAK